MYIIGMYNVTVAHTHTHHFVIMCIYTAPSLGKDDHPSHPLKSSVPSLLDPRKAEEYLSTAKSIEDSLPAYSREAQQGAYRAMAMVAPEIPPPLPPLVLTQKKWGWLVGAKWRVARHGWKSGASGRGGDREGRKLFGWFRGNNLWWLKTHQLGKAQVCSDASSVKFLNTYRSPFWTDGHLPVITLFVTFFDDLASNLKSFWQLTSG